MAAEYESVVCVKNEVFVFRIPPRPSNRGYRASDWKLDAPEWTGRLRVISRGKDLILQLEDKVSGEEFARCPVEAYPGVAVEPVMDSSRYFVIRIQEGDRSAFIGIGFTDRSDSFDLNVALQDHFKWLKKERELETSLKGLPDTGPKLDLSLKEGQTMKLNIGGKSGTKSRPKPNTGIGSGGSLLLPPPASGTKIPAPPGFQPHAATPPSASPAASLSSSSSASQPLVDLGPPADTTAIGAAAGGRDPPSSSAEASGWGDFTSSQSSASNWVQF